MPKHSPRSAAQISSLRASLNRQFREANRLLAIETDPNRQLELQDAIIEINRQQADLNSVAAAYAASHLGPSEAESALVGAATRIRNHTTGVQGLTKLLNSIATVAGILTNLLVLFG